MTKKLSIVIPTLQKNKTLLHRLVASLQRDEAVSEIIIIDNSNTGIDCENRKLRVISPGENIFVNPAWNLGVKEAKEEIVALLNDDITIPENFCRNVASAMTPEMGIVGISAEYVIGNQGEPMPPETTSLQLEPGGNVYGVALFFYKASYVEIPQEMKIFCGDTWLIHQTAKLGKPHYKITGQKIYHFESMSVKSFAKNPILRRDKAFFEKAVIPFRHRMFGFGRVHGGIRIWLLGIKITWHNHPEDKLK